jgi:Zn-dependent M28 family amino/carboxypeptidase
MIRSLAAKSVFMTLTFLTLADGGSPSLHAQSIPIASDVDLRGALEKAPCDDEGRQAGVTAMFASVGAAEDSIVTQKLGKIENVIITKPGKTTETVIVGAHYDKTNEGCGVIDNWTGIVILANLYKTIKELDTQKTFVFAAFAKEEKGLLGSSAMADNIPKGERANVCAMVNFDSFGFTYPQALGNVSDGSLIKLAESVSKEMKLPFASAGISNASSDSASFRAKKIPSISLHGLDGRWQNFLHTNSDKLSNVNLQSVYIAYRHGLVMLSKIENSPCSAFRN